MEDQEHLEQQELLIQHLKDLVRENEKRFQDKTKEYDVNIFNIVLSFK